MDDEQHLLDSLSLTLKARGYKGVFTCLEGTRALALLKKHQCHVVLLDLFLPDISGEEVLGVIWAEHPSTAVIIITGVNEVDTAVRCIRSGALDYLVKPVEPERLITSVDRALKHSALWLENRILRSKLLYQKLQKPEAFEHILTRNAEMKAVFNYIEAVAPARDPVLITGETGTGKDLLAKALHLAADRAGQFVQVNTAGLDEHMFADTLFGHVRGAFTDARQARSGLVEQALRGTLFLDEIGDLSPASQVKLLHLIQQQEYFPLGADMPRKADVRIVAATNQDLEARMREGAFRRDLFYRLGTYQVELPPLRQRQDDICMLASYFSKEAAHDLGLENTSLPEQFFTGLRDYSFPGNIRELRALIFDGLARGGVKGLQEKLRLLTGRDTPPPNEAHLSSEQRQDIVFPHPLPSLESAAHSLIREALSRSRGNKAQAARMLGISKQALHQRLKKENCSDLT